MANSIFKYLESVSGDREPANRNCFPDNFPFDVYSQNLSRYTVAEQWYSGERLDEEMESEGHSVEKYPVRINPLKSTVQKHTYALFGVPNYDERPLVVPEIVPKEHNAAGRKRAGEITDVLHTIWWENNGSSLLYQNGSISQIYGGCIFKIVWDPYDVFRDNGIRIEIVHPKYFVGIPSSDMWLLQEAWFLKPITEREAVSLGYVADISRDSRDEPIWMVEYYSPTEYIVTINGTTTASRVVDGVNGPERISLSGINPFGFVPGIYIPHFRTSGFYGENALDVLTGLIKEMNLAVKDMGDAVAIDSHPYVAMRNVQGAPRVIKVANALNVIDLKSNPGLTPGESQPDMFSVRQPILSSPMKDFIDILYNQYRRDGYVPPVAEGEDEGSQRSALTLYMRMLSLLWHAEMERIFWTTGLNILNKMLLKILVLKKSAKIKEEETHLMIKQTWKPILPQDQEALVNMATALTEAKLGSPERLLMLLGVDDVELEKQQILDWLEKIQENTVPVQPFGQGNTGQKTEKGAENLKKKGTPK